MPENHPHGELRSARRARVLLLTISHPARRNALHPSMAERGARLLDEAAQDPGVGAVVLSGEGEHFCSGGNLKRLRQNRQKPPQVQRESIERMHRWIRALRGCPKPVIAAVEGNAAGAGFSLALACDLIVAARDARFSMAYVKVGLSPDGGATAFLARTLPVQAAAEILLEGEPVGAERLHQLGLVNRLCEPGTALQQGLAWADKLSQGPPLAHARIKRLIDAAYDNAIPEQLHLERDALVEGLFTDEVGEGIAAFLEKRKPMFVKVED